MTEYAPNQVRQLADINEDPKKKSGVLSTVFVLIVFLAGIAVAGFAGYDWWKGRSTTQIPDPIPSPVISAAPSASPTSKIPSPAPTQKPGSTSQPKIQILNGSGIAGMAAKAKDALTTAGYSDITTGNAQAYEYETTVIMAKTQSQSSVQALRTILSKTYKLDDQKNDLDATSPYDVVVIVGKN